LLDHLTAEAERLTDKNKIRVWTFGCRDLGALEKTESLNCRGFTRIFWHFAHYSFINYFPSQNEKIAKFASPLHTLGRLFSFCIRGGILFRMKKQEG